MYLFIDSEYANGEGDVFTVDIPPNYLSAGDNEFLRVILKEFHGYKNFYNVNETNNHIKVKVNGVGNFVDIYIPPGDYERLDDIVIELMVKVQALLQGGSSIVDVRHDRKMRIELTGTFTKLEFEPQSKDTANLLGLRWNRQTNTGEVTTSTTTGDNKIFFVGDYPLQYSTAEHIYLRTHFPVEHLASTSGGEVTGTNILAKIPIHHEFISYSSDSDTGYYIDLPIKNISQIYFEITDHNGKRLPQSGTDQSTKGNMNYNFVLKVITLPTGKPSIVGTRTQGGTSSLAPHLLGGAPANI